MKRLFPFGIARAWAVVAVTNAAGDVQSNFATHLKALRGAGSQRVAVPEHGARARPGRPASNRWCDRGRNVQLEDDPSARNSRLL